MDILLSVKPFYVQYMRAGLKKVELRRVMRLTEVNKIYIYESSPIKMITAYLSSISISKMPIDIMWEKTKKISCISKDNYEKYFCGKQDGIAIFFEIFSPLPNIPLSRINTTAPQNYLLLNEHQVSALEKSISSVRD